MSSTYAIVLILEPLERWHGKRPNVGNLQEFGIPIFILNEYIGQDRLDLDDAEELPDYSPIQEFHRSLVGALMFLVIAMRPDIANAVRKLASYVSRPGEIYWKVAKRVLRYLKGTKTLGITYVKEFDLDS